MVNVHGCEKSNSCDICDKKFYLKWRLKKHMQSHEKEVKECKYYHEGKDCPYDEVGWKFKHTEDVPEAFENETEGDDNLCYYCNTLFENQDNLIVHMTNLHMDCLANFHPDSRF